MAARVVALIIALSLRLLAIVACGFGALLAIDAAQHRMLRSGTSFDIVFDRLEWAIYGALAASVAAAAALVLWQPRRFSLNERMALSCCAIAIIMALAVVYG
jgi:hypothetical protein